MGSGNIKKGTSVYLHFYFTIDSDKLVRQAISLGAEYYMAKPIQGELLLERIHQMLKQETPTKEAAETESNGAEGKSFRGAGKRNFHSAQSHGNLCQHKGGITLFAKR